MGVREIIEQLQNELRQRLQEMTEVDLVEAKHGFSGMYDSLRHEQWSRRGNVEQNLMAFFEHIPKGSVVERNALWDAYSRSCPSRRWRASQRDFDSHARFYFLEFPDGTHKKMIRKGCLEQMSDIERNIDITRSERISLVGEIDELAERCLKMRVIVSAGAQKGDEIF